MRKLFICLKNNQSLVLGINFLGYCQVIKYKVPMRLLLFYCLFLKDRKYGQISGIILRLLQSLKFDVQLSNLSYLANTDKICSLEIPVKKLWYSRSILFEIRLKKIFNSVEFTTISFFKQQLNISNCSTIRLMVTLKLFKVSDFK